MTDELKLCPFCGGAASAFHHTSGYVEPSWHVECDGCGNGTCHHETKADAITAWNTRAEDTALQQRVRELEDNLSFIAKWIERGLFCKTTSPQDAISLIAHSPGMPWHSKRWDVDHKPYAEAFYKTFPKALGDAHD